MLISELPENLRNLARQRQRENTKPDYSENTDILIRAFEWAETPEGVSFWRDLDSKVLEKQTDDQIIF